MAVSSTENEAWANVLGCGERHVPVISVRNIAKSYGSIRALHDVSFDIEPGEIVGLLGSKWRGQIHRHQNHHRLSASG